MHKFIEHRSVLAALLLLPSLAGCATARVGAEGVAVPKDSANICESQCRSIGLELSAVAIMANNVGCVCQAAESRSAGAAQAAQQAAPTTAGMATIMLQDQVRQQRQRQQQRGIGQARSRL